MGPNNGKIIVAKQALGCTTKPRNIPQVVAWLLFASPRQLDQGEPFNRIGGVPLECNWREAVIVVRAEALDSRETTVWKASEPIKEVMKKLGRLSLNDMP